MKGENKDTYVSDTPNSKQQFYPPDEYNVYDLVKIRVINRKKQQKAKCPILYILYQVTYYDFYFIEFAKLCWVWKKA